jgi:hypothetical protein
VRSSLLHALIVPALAAAFAGCGKKTQSAVDVPVTLAAVRALHHPPEVLVEVERKERHMGGGGCGHSALCALLIPIIAYDRVFPETWDEAKVSEGGIVSYEGRFRTSGELIEARVRKGSFVRVITVLPLDALKRRVVVEAARAHLAADGTEGPLVKTPIVPQIDLPAEYRKALAAEKDEKDRADLLVEAATWLDEESLPLLREALPGEGDVSAARILAKGCKDPGEAQGKAVRAELLASLSAKPGPKTAAEGLRCAVVGHDARAARPFAQALGALICESPSDAAAKSAAQALRDVSRSTGDFRSEAELQAAKGDAASKLSLCTRVERKVLLALTAGLTVTPADLELGLASDALGDEIVSLLFVDKPELRAAVFAALPKRKYDSALLGALAGAQWTPDARELTLLAEVYPRTGTSLNGGGRDGAALSLFARAKGDPLRLGGARKQIEAAVSTAPVDERPRLRAALLVMGDRSQALPASRALQGMQRLPGTSAQEAIVGALRLAGCKDEEILDAARRAATVKDEERGALCAR